MSGLSEVPTPNLNVLQRPLARGQPHPGGREPSPQDAPHVRARAALAVQHHPGPSLPSQAPLTMTEGPPGPKTGAQSCLWPQLPRFLQGDQPVASWPWLLPMGPGAQGPQPRREGELQGAAVGAVGSSLPRAGRRVWHTGWGRGWLGPALPGQAESCPTPVRPGQLGCQGQSGLARSPSGLPLLCSTSSLSHP